MILTIIFSLGEWFLQCLKPILCLVELFLFFLVVVFVLVVVVVVVVVGVDIVNVGLVGKDAMVLTVLLLGKFLQMTTGLVVLIVPTSSAGGTCASTVEEMMMCVDLGLGLLWRRG